MPIWLIDFFSLFKFIPERIFMLILEKTGYLKQSGDRPEVILDRIENDRIKGEDYFIVKNIGSKTALNIELSSLKVITKMPFNLSEDIIDLFFEFTKIDNLDSKQEKRIDCNVYVIERDGRKVLSNSAKNLYFSPMFNKNYARVDNHLLFEYNDSFDKKYLTHFTIGKSSIETKGVYLIRRPQLINKMFRRYGLTLK